VLSVMNNSRIAIRTGRIIQLLSKRVRYCK
jgi:hypothetical protein